MSLEFAAFQIGIKQNIHFIDKRFEKILKNYDFLSPSQTFNYQNYPSIFKKFNESKLIIINHHEEINNDLKTFYFIICFENTILIIDKSSSSFIHRLFSSKTNLSILFLTVEKDIFDQYIKIQYNEIELSEYLKKEIISFNKYIDFSKKEKKKFKNLWDNIRSCISGYLINQSYQKLTQNRIQTFFANEKKIFKNEIDVNDYIKLREIGGGSSGRVYLIYHIEKQELFSLKIQHPNRDPNSEDLFKRESLNYEKLKHPLLLQYYGKVKNCNYLVIEFINGKTLSNIKNLNLDENVKITYIFELLLIFEYLHSNKFIYRDLKNNNVMIDQNKNIVLIDYDRLVEEDFVLNRKNTTADFGSLYVAPEVNYNNSYSYSCDIYSLGKMMYYIICEKDPTDEMKSTEFGKHQKIYEMCQRCIIKDQKKRPTISELINEFYFHYFQQIQDKDLNMILQKGKQRRILLSIFFPFYWMSVISCFNMISPHLNYVIGSIYYEGKYVTRDIHKCIYNLTISAEKNHPKAQALLGYIYYTCIDIQKDINKAIHYLTLAANQNDVEANYRLGCIFHEGKYIKKDINKAIKYLNIASSYNYLDANARLVLIYSNGIHIRKDINKALYYGSLAADQNHAESQRLLGMLYFLGHDVQRDFKKAIYYFEKASNQNNVESQYMLGVIHYRCDFGYFDLNKAINYLTLASIQNHALAQLLLGFIYYKKRDLNKAISYYTKAADQNQPDAIFNLGYIYYHENNDIDKAIHYFEIAANLNQSDALYNLGNIFFYDDDRQDIEKAMRYYSLAARRNNHKALIQLGSIYYEGNNVKSDINEAINYLLIPAKQNNSEAQYRLGMIYLENITDQSSINKALYFLTQSSLNRFNEAHFPLGYLYHEGKYVKRDVKKALDLYIDASNVDDEHGKNNFAVIYKNGFGNEIPQNIPRAVELFSEITTNGIDNEVSSFNLANLYFYHLRNEENIDKAINLLVNSANEFHPSKEFLCIILIYKHGFELDKINAEIVKYSFKPEDLISEIVSLIINSTMNDEKIFDSYLKFYQDIDYIYDYKLNIISLRDLMKQETKIQEKQENPKIYEISVAFYEGFGYDLLSY